MENDSKKIINVVTVDKRQTDRRSAVMEKQAFILTVDQLIKEVKLVDKSVPSWVSFFLYDQAH